MPCTVRLLKADSDILNVIQCLEIRQLRCSDLACLMLQVCCADPESAQEEHLGIQNLP